MSDELAPTWVLYIDLLGFSTAVLTREGRERITRVYRDVVSIVHEHPSAHSSIVREDFAAEWRSHVKIFSDSIFVFFDGEWLGRTPVGPAWLIPEVVRRVSSALWRHAIPHRGALAFGDCLLDHKADIFLGEPIVRAYQLEQSMDLMAIAVTPASSTDLWRYGEVTTIEFDVPLKPGNPLKFDGLMRTCCVRFPYTLPPLPYATPAPIDPAPMDGFLRASAAAPAALRRRYVNTAQFFSACGARHPEVDRLASE